MKASSNHRNFFRSSIAGLCLLPFTASAANIVVGTGSDHSYLVLESGSLGQRTYEVYYDSGAGAQDAKFLLTQALAGDSSLSATFFNYGTSAEPNYYVDSINGEHGSGSGTIESPYTWWVQWVAGGQGFQNPDYSFNPGAAPQDTWTQGYGISSPNRTIAPGSWDALVLSDGSQLPSVGLVPEASSLLLGALGAVLLVRRRNR